MGEIYFDNSSTTRPSQAVVDIVVKTMTDDYGNPSSLHKKGVDAEKYLRASRETIAGVMKVSANEIYFTSGGTESNNWALIGTALANRRKGHTILTTTMEHPAVAEPLRFLEDQGFVIRKIPVDRNGVLDLDALSDMLDDDVILVSTMYVNNEIGAVVPVADVAKLIREKAKNALYHVDAIQAFGKYRIYPRQLGVDMLSVSGHKLHGPKGTGFLYIRNGAHVSPLIYGGGQQNGMRSGTENVPGIAGLGVAVREAYTDFDAKIDHLYDLKEHLEQGLDRIEGTVIHGLRGRAGAPQIVNVSILGVGSEVLLHTLEDHQIYVSAGSACSTHKRLASPTMTAIGAPREESSSSVRFSFCETNTAEEVDEALKVLEETVPMLRRYRAK
ncbi:MAG: cysteine desulfurase family protein [Chordicoccus sp.]